MAEVVSLLWNHGTADLSYGISTLSKVKFPLNSTAKFNTVKFQEKQSCIKAKLKTFGEKKTKSYF